MLAQQLERSDPCKERSARFALCGERSEVQSLHMPMDKKKAQDIYWVLASKYNFNLFYADSDDYLRIKKERVKIANRYIELKRDHTHEDAEIMATIEWLMNLQVHECEPKKP